MTAFIFDFDMTLVDSINAITRGLNKIADHFQLPEISEYETRKVISLETKAFWTALWGYYDPAWRDYFIDHVASQERDYLALAEGAEELLTDLKEKGAALGLATNRSNAWAALNNVNIAHYFDTAVGVNDVRNPKPAPDMLLLAMENLKASPEDTLYIGDAVCDMQAAKAAGIKAIGVCMGGLSREVLLNAGAWQVYQDLKDLKENLDLY